MSHFTDAFIKSNEFLKTPEWRRLRMRVFVRDGARCACCGTSTERGVRLNVDHIQPRKTHPHLALDLNNLQILCELCNHGKGNLDQTKWMLAELNPEACDRGITFRDLLDAMVHEATRLLADYEGEAVLPTIAEKINAATGIVACAQMMRVTLNKKVLDQEIVKNDPH